MNSVDCDGMMQGYDIPLIKSVTDVVKIPVTACGGAGNIQDLKRQLKREGRMLLPEAVSLSTMEN